MLLEIVVFEGMITSETIELATQFFLSSHLGVATNNLLTTFVGSRQGGVIQLKSPQYVTLESR
jgi:hypothetical protein